jgi:hypothetical protein
VFHFSLKFRVFSEYNLASYLTSSVEFIAQPGTDFNPVKFEKVRANYSFVVIVQYCLLSKIHNFI